MTATLSDYVFSFIAITDPSLATKYQRTAAAILQLSMQPEFEPIFKCMDFNVINGCAYSRSLENMLFVSGTYTNPVAQGRKIYGTLSAADKALLNKMKEFYLANTPK